MDALTELLDGPVVKPPSHITIYEELLQHSDEWRMVRCGLITASEMKCLITPTLKIANNNETRTHIYELASQRITNHVEPTFQSYDMLRGQEDEIHATALYHQKIAPLTRAGFITNNKWGFTLGYSPDALVGNNGLVECKSRKYKYQLETIVKEEMPDEFMIQVQTALLVSERSWCDFVSFPERGGLPMFTKRIYSNEETQKAILEAAEQAESKIVQTVVDFEKRLENDPRLIPTERREEVVII